ncbi:MAG: amidohydrolase family protein [Burkholderiales bacterium]
MLIVDSQVHIWGANTPERPWPQRGEPQRAIPFGKDELLREMDKAGVDRTVIVPPMWEGDRNDLAIEAARTHPDRFAIMGRLDATAPESKGKLRTWRAQPGMMGLRFSFTAPILQPLLTEGRMDWVWNEAEEAGVPLYVLVKPSDVQLIDQVAARHPGLKLVMDHLALPLDKKDDEAFRGLDNVLALARRPNIAVKVSSLPNFSTQAYPYRNLHPFVRRVYDAFGAKRMFWGSDLTRLSGTYRECVTMFAEEIPWLSQEDLSWIMGRGVCDWIGWK